MSPDQLVADAKTKLNQNVDRFKDTLKTLRTGRASASMLQGVVVEVYGTSMPINQVATVAAPEAQLLQITPFEYATTRHLVLIRLMTDESYECKYRH
jgi:ribosome recycling factor